MKKWLGNLEDKQHEWLTTLAAETGIKGGGSAIMRAALDRAMTIETGDFKLSLLKADLKVQLDVINTQRKELEQQAQELQRKLKGERVTA